MQLEKDKVIKILTRARMNLCVYTSSDFCDCKYGNTGEYSPRTSEQSGCPEIRSIIQTISNMTDTEFNAMFNHELEVEREMPWAEYRKMIEGS